MVELLKYPFKKQYQEALLNKCLHGNIHGDNLSVSKANCIACFLETLHIIRLELYTCIIFLDRYKMLPVDNDFSDILHITGSLLYSGSKVGIPLHRLNVLNDDVIDSVREILLDSIYVLNDNIDLLKQ